MSLDTIISEGWYDFVDGKLTKTDLVTLYKDDVEIDYVIAGRSITNDDVVIEGDKLFIRDAEEVEESWMSTRVTDVEDVVPKFLFLTAAEVEGKLNEDVITYDVEEVGFDKNFYLLDATYKSVVMYKMMRDYANNSLIFEHAILNYFANGVDHTVVSVNCPAFKSDVYTPAFDDDLLLPFYVLFETEGAKFFNKLSVGRGSIDNFNNSLVTYGNLKLLKPVVVLNWFDFEHCNEGVVRELAVIVDVFVNKVDRRYDYVHITVLKKHGVF